jgi:hypothetical protein
MNRYFDKYGDLSVEHQIRRRRDHLQAERQPLVTTPNLLSLAGFR